MNNTFETRDDGLYIGGKKVLAGWESFSGWYWFGTEVDRIQDSDLGGAKVIKDDKIWFGFVQGLDEEWGYFSQAEIESLAPRTWKIKDVDLPHAGRRH